MAQVTLNIHGKPYNIDCDAGQEKRVLELGHLVDVRLREIAASGAASTEAHLLVLTALLLSDEIFELRETMNNMARQTPSRPVRDVAPAAPQGLSSEEEQDILDAIDHLAARIDSVAERLAKI